MSKADLPMGSTVVFAQLTLFVSLCGPISLLTEKITYANFICNYRPHKSEPYRICLTVGGEQLDCPYDTSSPAESLLETKLLLNSTISDAHLGARFMSY